MLRRGSTDTVAGCLAASLVACAPAHPPASAHDASHRGSGRTESPPGTPHDEPGLAAKYDAHPAVAVEHGQASYYGNSLAGHRTASGERYDPEAFTAAHRTLLLGTIVRVVRVDTGDTVYVRITDRGPFGSAHRIIDLSHAAAESLHMIRMGVAEVRLEVLAYGQHRPRTASR